MEDLNSPRAENLIKVFEQLPAFDVEKRLRSLDEMVGKLIEENQRLYMALCGYQANVFCGHCGHKVTIRLKMSGYVCNECNKML